MEQIGLCESSQKFLVQSDVGERGYIYINIVAALTIEVARQWQS